MDNESLKQTADVLLQCIPHLSPESPEAGVILSCLADIILLNWDFFSMIQLFSGNTLLKFAAALFEESRDSKFVCKWQSVVRPVQVNLHAPEVFMTFIEMLASIDISSEWFSLCTAMLAFVKDYAPFMPLVQRIQAAAQSMQFPNEILKLCWEILGRELDDDGPENIAFIMAFIEIMKGTADWFLANDRGDAGYTYIIYAWELILMIQVDFFIENDMVPFLCGILEYVMMLIGRLAREDDLFVDFLDTFGSVILELPLTPDLQPVYAAFMDALWAIVDSSDFYQTETISKVFEKFSSLMRPFYRPYIESKFETPCQALFFAIASSSEADQMKYGPDVIRLLLEVGTSPSVTLFCVKKFSPRFPEAAGPLLERAVSFMPVDPEGVLECIDVYTQCVFSEMVKPCLVQIIPMMNTMPNHVLQSFCVSLFRVESCLDPEHQAGVVARIAQKMDEMDSLGDFMDFIQPVITATDPNAHAEFKNELFQQIFSRMYEVALAADEEIQCHVATFIYLAMHHGYIADKNMVAQWICSALRVCPIVEHFRIFENLIDLFPIDGVIEFILSWDFTSNDVISGMIVELLKLLYDKWSGFWTKIPPDFLVRLLTVGVEVVVNNAFDIFDSILRTGTEPGFVMFVIDTIFKVMPVHYMPLQIQRTASFVQDALDRELINGAALREVLLANYSIEIPPVAELAARLDGPLFGILREAFPAIVSCIRSLPQ